MLTSFSFAKPVSAVGRENDAAPVSGPRHARIHVQLTDNDYAIRQFPIPLGVAGVTAPSNDVPLHVMRVSIGNRAFRVKLHVEVQFDRLDVAAVFVVSVDKAV
jgi:hypothetical protein